MKPRFFPDLISKRNVVLFSEHQLSFRGTVILIVFSNRSKYFFSHFLLLCYPLGNYCTLCALNTPLILNIVLQRLNQILLEYSRSTSRRLLARNHEINESTNKLFRGPQKVSGKYTAYRLCISGELRLKYVNKTEAL